MRFLNGFTFGGTGYLLLDAAGVLNVPNSAWIALAVALIQLYNTRLINKVKREKESEKSTEKDK